MNVTFPSADCYELRDFRFDGLSGRKYVIFDLEATGPLAESNAITQIGAVALGETKADETAFETLVQPWEAIPPKIEALTGISNDRVADAPGFARVWDDFRNFCGDAVLVTQCGYEFDFPLLDRECDRVGVRPLPNVRLDTKSIFAILHPERTETFSTDFLCDYYGINRSEFRRHDALGDARLITRIFRAELTEAQRSGVDALTTDCIRIKRFLLPPL